MIDKNKPNIAEMRREVESLATEKLNKVKGQLQMSHEAMVEERSKWERRVQKLEEDLVVASDRLYMSKRKSRDVMQKHLDQARGKQNVTYSIPACNQTSSPFTTVYRERRPAPKLH